MKTLPARCSSWEGFLTCVVIFVILYNHGAHTAVFMTMGTRIQPLQLVDQEGHRRGRSMTFVIVNGRDRPLLGSIDGPRSLRLRWLFHAGVRLGRIRAGAADRRRLAGRSTHI